MDVSALGRILFAFLFVLGLMLGIAWILRRLKIDEKLQGRQQRRQGALFVGESLYLDARRRLVVVGHGRQRYLMLLSAQGDVTLGALPPEEEGPDATP
jgi:flagellar biogenesis protein FliO